MHRSLLLIYHTIMNPVTGFWGMELKDRKRERKKKKKRKGRKKELWTFCSSQFPRMRKTPGEIQSKDALPQSRCCCRLGHWADTRDIHFPKHTDSVFAETWTLTDGSTHTQHGKQEERQKWLNELYSGSDIQCQYNECDLKKIVTLITRLSWQLWPISTSSFYVDS